MFHLEKLLAIAKPRSLKAIKESEKRLSVIRYINDASKIHEDTNQKYGKDYPYRFHISAVTHLATDRRYLPSNIDEETFYVIAFGAAYHDTIEDARLTYNDVMKIANKTFKGQGFENYKDMALKATEIVYALTNEKGRTRQERANEKYYEGIRSTPYASYVKACDRMANIEFSANETEDSMFKKYVAEMPHFLESIGLDDNEPIVKILRGYIK